MMVKLTGDFEVVVKNIQGLYKSAKGTAEIRKEPLDKEWYNKQLSYLSEALVSECKYRSIDVNQLYNLGYLIDIEKTFGFTEIYWNKIVKAALAPNPMRESKKSFKESTDIYNICNQIEKYIQRADVKRDISYNIRYKFIDCRTEKDYVVFTYVSQEARPDDIFEEVGPLLKRWLASVQAAGYGTIILRAYERGHADEAVDFDLRDPEGSFGPDWIKEALEVIKSGLEENGVEYVEEDEGITIPENDEHDAIEFSPCKKGKDYFIHLMGCQFDYYIKDSEDASFTVDEVVETL